MSTSREAFEALHETELDRDGEDYRYSETRLAWEAWQASRKEALEAAVKACEGMRFPSRDQWFGAITCVAAIRALADDAPAASQAVGAPPLRYKPNEDCS